jgi:hypothetical protein
MSDESSEDLVFIIKSTAVTTETWRKQDGWGFEFLQVWCGHKHGRKMKDVPFMMRGCPTGSLAQALMGDA